MTSVIPWTTGSGNITLTYNGQGNGSITVATDENLLRSSRQQVVTVSTGSVNASFTVVQAACPLNFKSSNGYYIRTADNKMFNVEDVNS